MKFPERLITIVRQLAQEISKENDLGRNIGQLSEALNSGNDSQVGMILGALKRHPEPYGSAFNLLFGIWGRSRAAWRISPELDGPDTHDVDRFQELVASFSAVVRAAVHEENTGPSGKNKANLPRRSNPLPPPIVLPRESETADAVEKKEEGPEGDTRDFFELFLKQSVQ